MRGDLNSSIDFCLGDNRMWDMVDRMKIDENRSRWDIGADHNMMEISMETKISRIYSSNETKERKWNIRRETNWESYEANLNRKMDDWNMQMGNGGDNDIIKAYDNLVALIISAAEEEIGTKTFKTEVHNKY